MNKDGLFESFKKSSYLVTNEIRVSQELKEKTINKIIDSKEQTQKESKSILPVHYSLKKIAVMCSLCILTVFIVGFSKPLILSLNQLVARIHHQINQGVNFQDETKYNLALDELEQVNKESIDNAILTMKPGEVKEISFDSEYGQFNIKIGKAEENVFKIFWIGDNEKIRRDGLTHFKIANINSTEDIIKSGKFAPLLDPIPANYKFDDVTLINGSVVSIDYIGSDESKIKIKISSYTRIEENKELVYINGLQGVYSDGIRNDGIPYGKLSLYLGEEGKYRVVEISTQYGDNIKNKEDLIKIANGIKFYNEDDNISGYRFHPKLISHYINYLGMGDSYARLMEAFENKEEKYEFKINNMSFLYNHRNGMDTYRIRYDGTNYEEANHYFKYPSIMPKDIYEKCSFEYAVMFLGGMSDFILHYNFSYQDNNFKKDDSTIGVVIQEENKMLQQYPILDILVERHMEDGTFFDSKGHPFCVYKSSNDKQKMITTILNLDGKYIRYTLSMSTKLFENFKTEDLIRNIH